MTGHTEHIHTSPSSSEPILTSHSSLLIAAILQSVDTKAPIKELKSALDSDTSWCKAFKWESKDS